MSCFALWWRGVATNDGRKGGGTRQGEEQSFAHPPKAGTTSILLGIGFSTWRGKPCQIDMPHCACQKSFSSPTPGYPSFLYCTLPLRWLLLLHKPVISYNRERVCVLQDSRGCKHSTPQWSNKADQTFTRLPLLVPRLRNQNANYKYNEFVWISPCKQNSYEISCFWECKQRSKIAGQYRVILTGYRPIKSQKN